jgi:hypothetical protein
MLRKVSVSVDTTTWTTAPVPSPLTSVNGVVRDVSMLDVLLSVAVWTRPPTVYGFSLSDCWAWMRYLPALAPQPDLILRDEWTALDPHHKTVLSGDFGVGFSTLLLSELLGFVDYADTLRVVSITHPQKFYLGRTAKRRGPAKSPDYIATDAAGKFSVLECKGGQTSRDGLLDSMKRGVEQKKNVKTIGGTTIEHQLVAGVYVPQWGAADRALFAVQDPSWPELSATFAQMEPETAARAVQQVSAAKQLAGLELGTTANTFVRARRAEPELERAIAVDLREERSVRPTLVADGIRLVREHRWSEPTDLGEEIESVGLRYTAFLPGDVIEQLRAAGTPEAAADWMRTRPRRGGAGLPRTRNDGRMTVMEGTAGVTYELEILEA